MPKKTIKKLPLSETTLLWLSVFFMLFAVFVILMYVRQVEDLQVLLKYQKQQRDAFLQLVAPSPTPKAVKY